MQEGSLQPDMPGREDGGKESPLLPPPPSAFLPQLLFSISFATSQQALTHSLALGHLLLIGD